MIFFIKNIVNDFSSYTKCFVRQKKHTYRQKNNIFSYVFDWKNVQNCSNVSFMVFPRLFFSYVKEPKSVTFWKGRLLKITWSHIFVNLGFHIFPWSGILWNVHFLSYLINVRYVIQIGSKMRMPLIEMLPYICIYLTIIYWRRKN